MRSRKILVICFVIVVVVEVYGERLVIANFSLVLGSLSFRHARISLLVRGFLKTATYF